MFDFQQYRDSTYGLLLPSAITFACFGVNDHQVRRFREAQLLQEGIDLIRLTNQGVTRIFYTLAGLQKLCNLLPGQQSEAFQQVLAQLLPQQPVAQLPAMTPVGGGTVHLAPPFTAVTAPPFPAVGNPLPPAPLLAEPADPFDPMLPAAAFAQPAPPPPSPVSQWGQMGLTQHPVVEAIAEEVSSRVEVVLAQQAWQQAQSGVVQTVDAQTLLEAQRLIAETTLRSQHQSAEAVQKGAQIAREIAEDRKPQDTLNSSLLTAAFVCGLFVLVSAWNSVQEGLSRPYKQPFPQQTLPQQLQLPSSYPNPQ